MDPTGRPRPKTRFPCIPRDIVRSRDLARSVRFVPPPSPLVLSFVAALIAREQGDATPRPKRSLGDSRARGHGVGGNQDGRRRDAVEQMVARCPPTSSPPAVGAFTSLARAAPGRRQRQEIPASRVVWGVAAGGRAAVVGRPMA